MNIFKDVSNTCYEMSTYRKITFTVVHIYVIPLTLNFRNWLNGIGGVLHKVEGSNLGVNIFIGGLLAFRYIK